VVSSRIDGTLNRKGKVFVCNCPFHHDKTPSFNIRQDQDGYWLYNCFGCGENGNVFQFIQKLDNLDFGAAVEKVVNLFSWQSGKEVVEEVFHPVAVQKKQKVEFDLSQMAKAEELLAETPGAIDWLENRGISLETARKFHLGFMQSAKAISPFHALVDNGWIIFPCIRDGKIVALKYRSIKEKEFLQKKNMDAVWFGAQHLVPFDDAFVVEGEADALILSQAGYVAVSLPNATTPPTPEMRDELVVANTIYLAGDTDPPGQAAMDKLWAELQQRTFKIEWEDAKDANEFFLNKCQGDISIFRNEVERLKQKARERPIPHFYDLRESLKNMDDTNPMDNPRRFHWRQPSIDEMAITLPGNVISLYATLTGSGKTTLLIDPLLYEAIDFGSVVVNYSGELSPDEYSRLIAAFLNRYDRLKLKKEHFNFAAEKLQDARFYVGYKPGARMGEVMDMMEWAIRRLGARIVVFDHLHFICRGEKDETKAQADAMRRIKDMAVKYQVIPVVVGQSRKAQPAQKGKVSEAHDAKGSEAFISDASTTYHMHRNTKKDIDWEHPETWPGDLLDPETDIRLYKCRAKGPGKAVVRLYFEGANARFTEMMEGQKAA
jgi:CHC2 zinc finger/DnaB-like helicase C terminal domain/Toprim-like